MQRFHTALPLLEHSLSARRSANFTNGALVFGTEAHPKPAATLLADVHPCRQASNRRHDGSDHDQSDSL
jgi:hypothetical protein